MYLQMKDEDESHILNTRTSAIGYQKTNALQSNLCVVVLFPSPQKKNHEVIDFKKSSVKTAI